MHLFRLGFVDPNNTYPCMHQVLLLVTKPKTSIINWDLFRYFSKNIVYITMIIFTSCVYDPIFSLSLFLWDMLSLTYIFLSTLTKAYVSSMKYFGGEFAGESAYEDNVL